MLRFTVGSDGLSAEQAAFSGAYVVGSDGVPLRAEIQFQDGHILCEKRATGPAALALVWPVGRLGSILLETTRLPEREQPYVLEVELLRGRLMRLSQKREEWGLADCEFTPEQHREFEACRDVLIEAFKADTPAQAAKTAQAGLERSVAFAEAVTSSNAERLLNHRRQLGGFPRRLFGCLVNPSEVEETALDRLAEGFDFAVLPIPWKLLEPNEKEFNWGPFDSCVQWLTRHRVPIKGCGLVCFSEVCVPDWLYIWEHDFDTVRDLIHQHIRQIVGRYGKYIQVWDVITGIHAATCFPFNFEQLMDLTRMAASVVRQLAPQATIIVDLVSPWGEYYARNQRTIPPLLYADMVVQSGIPFDAFGVHLYLGMGTDGMYVRDLFQVSSMLDRFASFGKPLHITAAQAPSLNSGHARDAWQGMLSPAAGGEWHRPWDEPTQAQWLESVYEIALSKPFIETISWRDLTDQGRHYLPGGGLLRADGSPKPAMQRLFALRENLVPTPAKSRRKR